MRGVCNSKLKHKPHVKAKDMYLSEEARERDTTPTPTPPADRTRDLSKSTHRRTRKMVNYACSGRSQGKLWWKAATLLTCKSFV